MSLAAMWYRPSGYIFNACCCDARTDARLHDVFEDRTILNEHCILHDLDPSLQTRSTVLVVNIQVLNTSSSFRLVLTVVIGGRRCIWSDDRRRCLKDNQVLKCLYKNRYCYVLTVYCTLNLYCSSDSPTVLWLNHWPPSLRVPLCTSVMNIVPTRANITLCPVSLWRIRPTYQNGCFAKNISKKRYSMYRFCACRK